MCSSPPRPPPPRFFSFCGKIDHIDQEGDVAKVHFVKPSAAKTALMLDGGSLEGATLKVTSDDVEAPAAASASPTTATHKDGEEIEQEGKHWQQYPDLLVYSDADHQPPLPILFRPPPPPATPPSAHADKPRSAIAAEYLAHGYILSDTAIQRAIEADQKYGISSRFLSFFNPLAEKVTTAAQPHVDRATTKAKEVDEKQGLSLKAQAGLTIGSKYYQAALASPFGSKVKAFYSSTAKEAQHIHEEALRIKEAKKGKQAGGETVAASGQAGSGTAPAEGVVDGDAKGTVPAAGAAPVTTV